MQSELLLVVCISFTFSGGHVLVYNTGCSGHYTVSIAVPGSILDNAQSAELRTYLVGQVHDSQSVFPSGTIAGKVWWSGEPVYCQSDWSGPLCYQAGWFSEPVYYQAGWSGQASVLPSWLVWPIVLPSWLVW